MGWKGGRLSLRLRTLYTPRSRPYRAPLAATRPFRCGAERAARPLSPVAGSKSHRPFGPWLNERGAGVSPESPAAGAMTLAQHLLAPVDQSVRAREAIDTSATVSSVGRELRDPCWADRHHACGGVSAKPNGTRSRYAGWAQPPSSCIVSTLLQLSLYVAITSCLRVASSPYRAS